MEVTILPCLSADLGLANQCNTSLPTRLIYFLQAQWTGLDPARPFGHPLSRRIRLPVPSPLLNSAKPGSRSRMSFWTLAFGAGAFANSASLA